MSTRSSGAGGSSLSLSDESRVLALDWGAKRVGMAISDPLGLTAQGLPTMRRRDKQQDMNFLRSLIRKHHVSLILLGNPLDMSGTAGPQTEHMREVARELEQRLDLEVRLWDERLTSLQAHRVLHEIGVIPSRRRESVDRMAAVLLLQNFLDSQARAKIADSEPNRSGAERTGGE